MYRKKSICKTSIAVEYLQRKHSKEADIDEGVKHHKIDVLILTWDNRICPKGRKTPGARNAKTVKEKEISRFKFTIYTNLIFLTSVVVLCSLVTHSNAQYYYAPYYGYGYYGYPYSYGYYGYPYSYGYYGYFGKREAGFGSVQQHELQHEHQLQPPEQQHLESHQQAQEQPLHLQPPPQMLQN
ncbi:unnamed protein product [Angiostrongylus costaricensis]|uniref:Uncharacterized protein n=1 Tax=Angiostrongylus costaricensis TaxID=334426 RepID=A0A0R3PRK9_ANGCS|nr:unnamed protein product [Angiostrongylus costaricensis]